MSIESHAEAASVAGALLKVLGVPFVAGTLATSLGFAVMWPKTAKEAFLRFALSIASSLVFGSMLAILVNSWRPEYFQSARDVARMIGMQAEVGYLVIVGVLMAIAASPAWLIGGAIARWFEKRKDQDFGEMAHDLAEVVKDVRTTM